MNDETPTRLGDYYREAESWSVDRERRRRQSERRAWIVAGVAAAIALIEAIAIVTMMPLKRNEPYTLLVDRQTGYIQALKPLERDTIAPDAALTRSFLAQYVIARETFNIDSLREDYRKVALWSAGEARSRYLSQMQASNPLSPLTALPRRALVEVQLRSISSLGTDTALIRFSTYRADPDRQGRPSQTWAAVVKYRFSGAAMSAADRLINPLGFQVIRYARNPEMLPEPQASSIPHGPDGSDVQQPGVSAISQGGGALP